VIGYLIDPAQETITPVEHSAKLPELYGLLQCDTLDAVPLAACGEETNGLAVYVDDNARLTLKATHEFQARRADGAWTDPILGRGLLVGFDAEGNETAPPLTLEQTRQWVRFLGPMGQPRSTPPPPAIVLQQSGGLCVAIVATHVPAAGWAAPYALHWVRYRGPAGETRELDSNPIARGLSLVDAHLQARRAVAEGGVHIRLCIATPDYPVVVELFPKRQPSAG
jgi:hypothetical protein